MADVKPDTEVPSFQTEPDIDKKETFLDLNKKQRKRELKSLSRELHDVPLNASDEDKLIILFRKFQTAISELSDSRSILKSTENRMLSIKVERDNFQDSYIRISSQKERLEALCRELQKQNHLIRDQSLAMAQSEDEKRKEVADRFQSGITEIQNQLNEYSQKNNNLREENQLLSEKLQKFITDHESREAHVQKLLKTHELEAKLAEAKLVQAKIQNEQEILKEKRATANAREECVLLKQRLDAHKMVEDKLKEQIEFYKNKYQAFNKTMSKSNDLIENTKREMDKMTKHVKSAESAALEWRSKWEAGQKALLEMIEECSKEKEKSIALKKQVDSLSNLCRALRGNGPNKVTNTESIATSDNSNTTETTPPDNVDT